MDYATREKIQKLERLAAATTFPAERAECERQIRALREKAGVPAGAAASGGNGSTGDDKRRRPDPSKSRDTTDGKDAWWRDMGFAREPDISWAGFGGSVHTPFGGRSAYASPFTSAPPPPRPTPQEEKDKKDAIAQARKIIDLVEIADRMEWRDDLGFTFYRGTMLVGQIYEGRVGMVHDMFAKMGIDFDIDIDRNKP